jgi:hypothetical protein
LSIWRATIILAAVLLLAIWPPPNLDATMRMLLTRKRQLTEPPRRRKLQMHAAQCLS